MDTNELEKAQQRKKKRQKERMRAILILVGIAAAVCLVLGVGIAAAVHIFSRSDKPIEVADSQTENLEDVDNLIPPMPDENTDATEEVEETTTEPEDVTPVEDDVASDEPADGPEEDLSAQEPEVAEPDAEPEEGGDAEEAVDPEPTAAELDEQIESRVNDKISSMELEDKVAQLFFLTPGQLMGKESTIEAAGGRFNDKLNEHHVGGILIESENMKDEENLISMISNIQQMAGGDMFIGVEDVGGSDSPFVKRNISENVIASQSEIGASLGDSGAYSAGISIGGELKLYGFNVDFAPMADISLKSGSVAQQRGFGQDAQKNASLTKNYVKGLNDQGIWNAVKYFPGLGDATQDGKNGQIVSNRTKEDLKAEYQPYLEAIDAGADFIMISHVGFPRIRGDRRPACLSKEIITDIVRDEWGYDGIVITDYMNKSCIYNSYTYAEAAAGAIEAGADMLLCVKNFEKSYRGLLDAVKSGQISEERIDESLRRIYRLKYSAQR